MAYGSLPHLPSSFIVLLIVIFSSCIIGGQSQLCNGSFCLGGNCVVENGNESCNCSTEFPSCILEADGNCTDKLSYCMHNSSCEINDQDGFKCVCAAGFTGERCEVELCDNDHCNDHGVCTVQADRGKSCECDPCYVGSPQCKNIVIDLCTNQTWTHQCDPDNTSPNCTTTCDSSTKLPVQFCNCISGYGGSECKQDIDECQQVSNKHPCNRHGTCNNLLGSYECSCDPGWTGTHCETDIDECASENDGCFPRNTASCDNLDGSFNCTCNMGYEGVRCNEPNCNIGELCSGHGTCQSNDTDWSCDCDLYYRGEQCEIEGPCVSSPCVHGTCEEEMVNGTWEHRCDCEPGWENSSNCNVNIDECQLPDPPCQNGGECSDTQGNFTCNCTQFWTGFNCDQDVKECEGRPCQHGDCIELEGGYSCNCSNTGFEGSDCELDIDECETALPCLNNGTCENTPGSYNCRCPAGWKGPDCGERDWCSVPGACSENTESCTNLQDKAACICNDGYYASDCSVMDPCLSNPCIDGRICNSNASDAISPGSSVQYICECTVDCEEKTPQLPPADPNLAVMIAVPIVAIIVLALIIGGAVCFVMARKKRATRGRYSPSRNEILGPNLQMSGVLKQPPEERLI